MGWTPHSDEPLTGFEMPVPDQWALRVTGSTCAVVSGDRALGGGTIENRERETIFSPPQLKVVYRGTLQGKRGRFVVICEVSADELESELAKDTRTFAG